MNREAFLDKGERIFVMAVSLVLGAEVLFTTMGWGTELAWPRLLLGIFGGVFILFLANRLYAGDRAMEKVAVGWAGFQIVLLLASLVIGPTPRSGALGFLQDLGLPWRSMAALKLVAYACFVAALVVPGSARAFLAARRGEDITPFVPATVVDTSEPMALTPDQTQLFGSLARLMQGAGAILILLGLFVILNAIPPSLNISQRGAIALLEGFLTLGLGALMLAPAQALAGLGSATTSTMGRIQAALQRLAWWHMAAGVIGVLLVVAVVLRFLIEYA
jgi:hypothetical protein